MCQLSVVESKSATFPSEKARHLLDDSVLEARSPRRGLALTSSSAVTNGLSLGKRLRPAHDSGRATVRCVLRVCLCHCAVPGGPSPSAERAPQQESPEPGGLCFQSLGLHEAPWVCPRPAGTPSSSPEHGRRVEGSWTHTRDPLSLVGNCESLAAAPAGLLSWGSHKPQRAEPSRGQQLGGPPGSHLCTCLHAEKPELGRMKN